jgi:hypothetical protein
MIDTVLVLLRWVFWGWLYTCCLCTIQHSLRCLLRGIGAWRERLLAGEVIIARTKTANNTKVPSTHFTNSTSFYDLNNDQIDMIEAQGHMLLLQLKL